MVKDAGERSNPLKVQAKAGQAVILWTNRKMQTKNLLRGLTCEHLFSPLKHFFLSETAIPRNPEGLSGGHGTQDS